MTEKEAMSLKDGQRVIWKHIYNHPGIVVNPLYNGLWIDWEDGSGSDWFDYNDMQHVYLPSQV